MEEQANNFTSLVDPVCRGTRCHGRGTCVATPGGGSDMACDCDLGYGGDFCEHTINGALSVPLTLSVLGVLLGLVTLAFVVAKIRRKKKKKQWRAMKLQSGSNAAE